jgi:hypothetical protein
LQRRAISKTAECGQDLWNTIIGKHGDLVDVLKSSIALAIKAPPKVRDYNLGAFEETNRLPSAFELEFIPEAGKVPRKKID